jgi:hypothetical protein
VGSGIGFTEPWLFNARHSFELRLKGLLLYSVWFEDVNKNILSSGAISDIINLRDRFPDIHSLSTIYSDYRKKIESVIKDWSPELTGDIPSLNDLLLSSEQEEILEELHELDKKSFRFRYPTLKKGTIDVIQIVDWKNDTTKLYSKTGLPKESGCFFDHIKTINSLHDLNTGLINISNYLNAIWDNVGYMQELMEDLMSEFGLDSMG